MNTVEKRSVLRDGGLAGQSDRMSAGTDVCVALVVALAIYLLGSAILLQGGAISDPQSSTEMSLLGP
jgi:hypothetical protein